MADAVLHKEYRDKLALLKPDQQMAVIYAMMDYADGKPVELEDPAARMAFAFIKDRIDADTAKYEAHVTNGRKGGRPKTEQNLTKPNETEQNLTEPNESEKSISISISKSISTPNGERESIERKPPEGGRARFTPPSVEEVKAYCEEAGISVDAQHFVDYYESNGWIVGKTKMKDWKATARNWARRDKENPIRAVTTKQNSFHYEGERKTDYDAILREEQLALAEQIRAAGGEP